MGCKTSEMLTPYNFNQNQVKQMKNSPQNQLYSEQARKLSKEKNLEQSLKIGNRFFLKGLIFEAIQIFKRIIQSDPNFKSEIEGLGNFQLTVCYYEWNVYKWYDENIKSGAIKQSPFDALCLCYSLLKGKKQYETQLARGIAWYQQMIQKHINSFQFLMGLGNLFQIIGSYDEALSYYSRVIDIKPTFKNAYVCKAMIYAFKKEDYHKACENAIKAIQLSPQNKNQYGDFILSICTQNLEEKIKKLKQSYNKYPYFPRIIYQIGICYGGRKKNYDQAIIWLKKCIKIAPFYTPAYHKIAVYYQLKLYRNKAKKWYFQSIKTRKTYSHSYDNLIDIYIKEGKTDQQILKDRQNQKQVNEQHFYLQIGKSFFRKGGKQNINRSKIWLRNGLSKYPKNHSMWDNLGLCFYQKKQIKKAKQFHFRSIQINQLNHIPYYHLATCYKYQHYLNESEIMYKKAIQICPRFSQAWSSLGNMHMNKKQYHSAIYYYRNAIKFRSSYTLAFANLGFCLIKINQHKQGFQSFSKAKYALLNDNEDFIPRKKAFLKKYLAWLQRYGEKIQKSNCMMKVEQECIQNFMEQFQQIFDNLPEKQSNIEATKVLKDITVYNQNKLPIPDILQITKEKEKNQQYQTQKFCNLKVEISLIELVQTNQQIDLFKDFNFFSDHIQLYSYINKSYKIAKQYFIDFRLLVDEVRRKSKGIPSGIYTKIPQKQYEKFKAYLGLYQEIFKKQLSKQKMLDVAKNIYKDLQKQPQINKSVIMKKVRQIWDQQISNILSDRMKNKVPTKFQVNDLIKATCKYDSAQGIKKALRIAELYCKQMQYQIISLENRLDNLLKLDAVLKIRIKDALCQLHLALNQNKLIHFVHSQNQTSLSILGLIFGDGLFSERDANHQILTYCGYIEGKNSKIKDGKCEL